MKPFSLEEFEKNPSLNVVTRDGRSVRIICTDAKSNFPVVALVRNGKNVEDTYNFKKDGTFLQNITNERDLFFDIEIKHGWVNLYRTERGFIIFGSVFETKEDALDELEKTDNVCKHIDTIQIEWEE